MQIFNFDLSTKNIAQVLNVKQGDVGRKFKAVITDRGVDYIIPAGARFSVWFSGPSGEGNYSAIGERTAFSVDGNTVTVELIAQMLANHGSGSMCLVLSNTDGTQLGLWNMIYTVEHVPGMGSKAAEEYYTAMSELAKQAIEAAATFETDPLLSVSGRAADAAAVGAQLVNKAPAGYGLGEDSGNAITTLAQLDAVKVNSFRNYYGEALPVDGAHSSNTSQGGVLTIYGQGCITQYFFLRYPSRGSVLKRCTTTDGSVWESWEWVNPPMIPGVEYRTTERWDGKPVYTKLVNCGKAVNNLTQISHGSTVTNMLRCYGNLGGYCTIPYFTKAGLGGNYTYWCNATTTNIEVFIGAEANVTAYTVYVQIWYTKD